MGTQRTPVRRQWHGKARQGRDWESGKGDASAGKARECTESALLTRAQASPTRPRTPLGGAFAEDFSYCNAIPSRLTLVYRGKTPS
jgi:hypothetical protein